MLPLFPPNLFVFKFKLFGRFGASIVFDNAINRTDFIASWLVIKANTFGTQVGVDDVGFLHLVVVADGFVGTFGFANVAVDTVGRDF